MLTHCSQPFVHLGSGELSQWTFIQCEIVLADEIFNKISKRAEPNFFHMLLSHKTGGTSGGLPLSLCIQRRNEKLTHFRKSLAVPLFCSKPDHDAFLLKHYVASWAKKETRSTLLIFALLTLSSPCETIASDNLACSQLSRSHGSEPKMIYTHRFLNINHRAQPSSKTDVRQCVCTVVVHLDRTWLSVDMACLSGPIFHFKCCYFSLVLFFYLFFCIFSDWLLHFILCFPHLAVQIFSSIYT